MIGRKRHPGWSLMPLHSTYKFGLVPESEFGGEFVSERLRQLPPHLHQNCSTTAAFSLFVNYYGSNLYIQLAVALSIPNVTSWCFQSQPGVAIAIESHCRPHRSPAPARSALFVCLRFLFSLPIAPPSLGGAVELGGPASGVASGVGERLYRGRSGVPIDMRWGKRGVRGRGGGYKARYTVISVAHLCIEYT